jgi:hypothetical protein
MTITLDNNQNTNKKRFAIIMQQSTSLFVTWKFYMFLFVKKTHYIII